MHACIHAYTHTHIHTHMHTNIHTCKPALEPQPDVCVCARACAYHRAPSDSVHKCHGIPWDAAKCPGGCHGGGTYDSHEDAKAQEAHCMPGIPVGATVPTFSRNFTKSLLGGTPANITRRCQHKGDSDSCGCDQDPYVRHDCPFGGESCGCFRCPDSFGPSFILHRGVCYEACPADTDFRLAFFEAPPASTPVEDQPPSRTYLSPTSVPTLLDPNLVSACPNVQTSTTCHHGCVECNEVPVIAQMMISMG